MGLGSGRLELLHLGGGQVAPEPQEAVLGLGGVADGGVFGGILGFEHLISDAGQVPGGLGQEALTLGKIPVTVFLLQLQLRQTLFREGKLRGGIRVRQGSEGGQGGHFTHRGQTHKGNVGVGGKGRQGLFIRAVNVDVPAPGAQLLHLGGGEATPLGQLFRRCMGGGALFLQGFFSIQTGGELLKEGLKFLVGQQGFLRLGGILLQGCGHAAQGGEALRIPGV